MSSHDWEMLIRLLLAAFLGGIVGIERGSGDRPAGFRTHILVCAGAGMYVLSIGSTAVMMVTLVTFHSWEKRFAGSSRNARRFIRIVAENEPGIITNITAYLTENGVKVRTLNVKNNSRKNEVVLELYLKISKDRDDIDIIRGLQSIEGIITLENVG